MLEIVESKHGYIVLVPCPHCGQYSEEDWQTLFAAYVDNASLRHLDCGKDFFVELSCKTSSVSLTTHEVDKPIQKACLIDRDFFRKFHPEWKFCPYCGERLSS